MDSAAAKKILVVFQGRKKVLSIPEREGVRFLTLEFRAAFGVKNSESLVTFQRYNLEFDDYIDLESDCEITDKEKLQAVVTCDVPLQSSYAEIPSSSPVLNGTNRKRPTVCESESSDVESENEGLGMNNDSAEENRGGESINDMDGTNSTPDILSITPNKKTHSKVMKSELDKIPLPDPFPLPQHFPHRLESALASGKLTKKEKQTFITEIASCMLRYKRYPDREDYTCVVRAIIDKYPFLKPNNGNPYDVLMRSLMNRFKEFRREKRIRLTPSRPKEKEIAQKSPGITMMPSEPIPMPGEDRISYGRHLKVLQVQFKKAVRNYTIVKELMERSFSFRRTEIIEDSLSLEQIFDKFPFLQEIDMCMLEMEFIMKNKSLRSSSRERWLSKVPKIINQAMLEASRKTSRFASVFSIEDGMDSSLHALYVLPLLLPDVRIKADSSKIIYFAEDCVNVTSVVQEVTTVTPYVLMTGTLPQPGQAFLVVDKIVLNEIEDFDNIPFILLSAYFVFNIMYPTGCNNLFSFLEVLLLQFPITKASITVKHFFTSLCH